MKFSAHLAATCALLLATSPVQAGDLLYAAIVGEFDAVWAFDSDLAPQAVDDDWFILQDVEGNYGSTLFADIQFFASGGLRIQDAVTDALLFEATGPQLFSGSTYAPHFTTGSYSLTSLATGQSVQMWIDYVPDALPYPEPATWAMLIAGFGMAGTAIRRRRWAAVSTNCAEVSTSGT